ncbi:unnamed protein product [Lactuca virosa]|uniref:Morc S5 domain-containing protein n=1 Tax=Lactuca virosa TaxID=75947 RepID=A0AAU9LA85_9ASTR|nr:unnamed protein product [Lactuca virosa]
MGSLQLEDIGPHGTKVLIYNLWLNDEGIYELNFDEDDEDIKLNDFTKAFRTLQRCQETWIKLVLKKKKSFQNLQSFTRRMVVTIIETSLMLIRSHPKMQSYIRLDFDPRTGNDR